MSEKIDDTPIRIPVCEFVEWFMTQQRAHYDKLLADGIRRLDAMPFLDEETKRAMTEESRALFAADLERCALELSQYVASGMRLPDEAVH